jgi:esterase/lipase superfamily enzyme
MIEQLAIDAFNTRLTANLNTIKTMRPAQLDTLKNEGSQAEALLKNRELALFIHQYKFELLDALSAITGHSEEDNSRRVAISNQVAGIDGFVNTLKRSVYMKNKIVTQQANPGEPIANLKGNEVL